MSLRNLALLVPTDPTQQEVARYATVTDDAPLAIRLDGDTDPLPFVPRSLVGGLAINDRVLVLFLGNSNSASHSRRLVIVGSDQ